MADNFLYSEQTETGYTNLVTAEDLNNIAIDLGASDFSAFEENGTPLAVDKLNEITKDLTSKGILHIGNCCKVSISDNIITVADGVCVFENGAKKRITESDPLQIQFIDDGNTNYVYMQNDIGANQIRLVNSTTNPSEAEAVDYVMLAEISKDKVLTDRRYWAISKVGQGKNTVTTIDSTFEFMPADPLGNYRYNTYEYSIEHTGNFLILVGVEENTAATSSAYPLQEGKEITIYHLLSYNCYVSFTKEGGLLRVKTWKVKNFTYSPSYYRLVFRIV